MFAFAGEAVKLAQDRACRQAKMGGGTKKMLVVTRIVIGLVGLFNIAIGFGFLLSPHRLAAAFFLSPVGAQGVATLRADFTGFFVGASVFALIGALAADARPLAVPIVMLGLALFGRIVSLLVDGVLPTTVPPMIVELVMILVLALGARVFSNAQRATPGE
jgi:hypothetical protein